MMMMSLMESEISEAMMKLPRQKKKKNNAKSRGGNSPPMVLFMVLCLSEVRTHPRKRRDGRNFDGGRYIRDLVSCVVLDPVLKEVCASLKK
jgi:hypothetical protein